MNKRMATLALFLVLMILPINAAAQIGISGVNVYGFRTVNCLQTGMDFFPENKTFRVKIAEPAYGTPDYTGENVGLGFVEVIFALDSIPGGLSGYMVIENGTEVEIVDQLINWTITPYTFEFDNGTQVDARHLTAFFYTFANHSIYNETSVTPLYGAAAMTTAYSSVLAESYYTPASDGQPEVVVDFDYSTAISGDLIFFVGGIVIGITIIAVVIIWRKRQ